MRRLTALCLAFLLLCTAAQGAGREHGFDNFVPTRSYTGQFADLDSEDWFYDMVVSSYELGLINGQLDTAYVPDSNISVAETLALGCRLLGIYTADGVVFGSASPWYQPYVDYALEHRLITEGQFADYGAKATRAQVAGILGSLPGEMLETMNHIEEGAIPDVVEGSPYAGETYRLYRAGILTGTDGQGSFLPDNPIKRSEVAAFVARIARPELRRGLTLTVQPVTLYSDSGASIQVVPAEVATYLALGWRTEPFTVSPADGAKSILNAATLTPLTTGYEPLDQLVGDILDHILTEDMTTYDKVKACYDYLIENISYERVTTVIYGYGPYYSRRDYLYVMEAISALERGTGACNNYSAAFLVMTRRIGLECYVFSGQTSKAGGGYTGHAWNVISVGGVDYVFDAQVEDNIAKGGEVQYYRFCKTFDQVSKNYIEYDTEASKANFGGFVMA